MDFNASAIDSQKSAKEDKLDLLFSSITINIQQQQLRPFLGAMYVCKQIIQVTYLNCALLFLQVNWVSKEWAKRAALPSHVVTMLDNFPTNLHPMSQFSAAITALNSESGFARAYSEGVHKTKYWEVSLQRHTQKTQSQ